MGPTRRARSLPRAARDLAHNDVPRRLAPQPDRRADAAQWGDRRPGVRAWVEQALAPTLEPGDIVVADNLSSHKIAAARAAIEERGAVLLFLPAYSPDANPIEELFAKLKSVVRRLAPRSREALSDAVRQALQLVTPTECTNYLANKGYRHSA
jgi:transposase